VGGVPVGGGPCGGGPVGAVPGGLDLVVCAMAEPAGVGCACSTPTTLNINAIRAARVKRVHFIDCSPLQSIDGPWLRAGDSEQ
jgi:hypothetical protein